MTEDTFLGEHCVHGDRVCVNTLNVALRPEVIESVFIMYRATGDPMWQEKEWIMFNAIRKHTERIMLTWL